MPLTPQFKLSQTLTHVNLEISVPHVRVSIDSVEVLVEEDTLHFSSPPYLLILKFPSQFAPSDTGESAQYDPSREGGMIFLELKKYHPELWSDLDLLGKLMQPRKSSVGTPFRAHVLSEESFESAIENDNIEDEESLPPNILDKDKPHYGFLDQFSGIFSDLVREGLALEMLQIPNPDETDANERRALRLETEDNAFDADRYLGDVDIEDDYIYESAMAMKPHWTPSIEALTTDLATMSTTDQGSSFFSAPESSMLSSIPYPILPSVINDKQQRSLLLGLLDILFSYVYDHLLTDGEPTIESSWTICTLSCTFSWLETFGSMDSIHDVIRFTSRRSLIYPYVRNVEFTNYCWDQVAQIWKSGRRCILRCLLQTRGILDKSECHYLGNKLYLDPYLLWLQSRVADETLSRFSRELFNVRKDSCWIEKGALGLNLVNLEQLLNESDADMTDGDEESEGDDDTECGECESIALENEHLDSAKVAISTALLDSEIGSHGVLKIIDEGKLSLSETLPAQRTTLIQEM